MDDTDLLSMLAPEPTAQEKAQAMAAALRGRKVADVQQQAGLLGQFTGDRVLAPLGHSLMTMGQQGYARADTEDHNQAMAQYHRDLITARMQPKPPDMAITTTPDGVTLGVDKHDPTAAPRVLHTALSKLGRAGGSGKGGGLDDKSLGALMKDLDPSQGRSGLFGKDQGIDTSAAKVLALVTDPHTGKVNYKLTVKQVPEFVQSVAGMLSSGSVPAQAQLEHLMPHTAGMSLAQKLEYLTGHPEDANAEDFVRQYADTATREQTLARQRIKSVQLARLAAHQGTYAKNPTAAKALARQYLKDLSDQDLDAAFQGKYQPQSQAPAPSADAQSALKSRIAVLKAQGLRDTDIKAQLAKEGLKL